EHTGRTAGPGKKPLSTRNSAATTSTTDGPRTTAACGSSIGASSGPGRSGSAGGRGEGRLPGKVRAAAASPPASATPGHTALGRDSESYLRNPLGQFRPV